MRADPCAQGTHPAITALQQRFGARVWFGTSTRKWWAYVRWSTPHLPGLNKHASSNKQYGTLVGGVDNPDQLAEQIRIAAGWKKP